MTTTDNAATETNKVVKDVAAQDYKYGWVTDIEQESAPPGLTEETIRWISAKKNEPEFMLEWRMKAFHHFMRLVEREQIPTWANVHYPPIDFQAISYYSAPKETPYLRKPRRGEPRDPQDLRKAGHTPGRAEAPCRSCRGRHLRQRFNRHHVQRDAGQAGNHLLLNVGSHP